MKDSLLNTNKNFDYSAFRKLANAASSTVAVNTFAFSFTAPGTYVFGMSSSPSMITIVKVMPENVACTTEAAFAEFTESNLLLMGVSSNNSIILSPDWALVMGLLLGALGLVVFIAGFMYYFRKRAWSSHLSIPQTYRHAHNKAFEDKKFKNISSAFNKHDPFISSYIKNGFNWCFPRRNKIAVGADELEAANPMEDQEVLEIEVDETAIQIPELAKHIKSHDDEVDKKLNMQEDLLNGLQNSLKKEVDDLKSLLTNTILEIAPNGFSSLKYAKLKALLNKLKGDIKRRDLFEASLAINEIRAIKSLEKLQNSLQLGSSKLSEIIIEEISDLAINENEKSDKITHRFESAILHEDIFAAIDFVREQTEVLTEHIASETRAHKLAESSFEQALTNVTDVFPDDVLAGYQKCMESDGDNDTANSDINHGFSAFSDRSPKFIKIMIDLEGHYSDSVNEIIEMGNLSLLDKQKELFGEKIASNLDDLKVAVNHLLEGINMLTTNCKEKRVLSSEERYELLRLIEEALENVPKASDASTPSDLSQLMSSLMTAFQNGKFPALERDEINDANDPNLEDPNSIEENKTETTLDSINSSNNIDDIKESVKINDESEDLEDGLGEMVINTNIDSVMDKSEDKKLDNSSAQTSLESIEEKRKNEMMDQIMHRARDNAEVRSASPDSVITKHSEEQENLIKKLEEERKAKLNRIDDLDADDFESNYDKSLITLANNRYVVNMRLIGAETRIKFFNLRVQFGILESNVLRQAENFNWSQETINQRIMELYSSQESKINDIKALIKDLKSKADQSDTDLKFKWLNDSSKVNLEDEIIKFKSETHDYFDNYRDELSSVSNKAIEAVKNECAFIETTSLKQEKLNLFDSPTDKESYISIVKEYTQSRISTVNMLCKAELEKLTSTQDSVLDILGFPTIWGQSYTLFEYQNSLHSRIIFGMQISMDAELRLIQVEDDLHTEALQMIQIG